MCVRENNNDLPHFWKVHNGKYLNTITNFVSQTKPSSVHGGILADDMGLGKTLEVIALILTNYHGGKPLAEPGDELVREVLDSEVCCTSKKILGREVTIKSQCGI